MKYRQLGNTGIEVSEICLGSMQFGWSADRSMSLKILNHSFDNGINFIDTANIYSTWAEGNPGGISETIIGEWLRESGIPRDEIIIATKVRGRMEDGTGCEGLSHQQIIKAVDGSLQRLGIDHIDLYQTHWPDENIPIEETLEAMDDLIKRGKVRFIGCSNYPTWRLLESFWKSDKYGYASFVSVQPHYNMVHRVEFEQELAEVCDRYSIAVLPYSPLAGGFLTGKYKIDHTPSSKRAKSASKYFTEKNWALLEKIERVGLELGGISPSQIALAWMLANPLVTSAIIGPRTIDQLEDNIGASGIRLTPDAIKILNEASAWE